MEPNTWYSRAAMAVAASGARSSVRLVAPTVTRYLMADAAELGLPDI